MVAALCLATDLGMGLPFEHGLEATLISMRLGDLLDVDSETTTDTFYVSLLIYVGCTTDAEKSLAEPISRAPACSLLSGHLRTWLGPPIRTRRSRALRGGGQPGSSTGS